MPIFSHIINGLLNLYLAIHETFRIFYIPWFRYEPEERAKMSLWSAKLNFSLWFCISILLSVSPSFLRKIKIEDEILAPSMLAIIFGLNSILYEITIIKGYVSRFERLKKYNKDTLIILATGFIILIPSIIFLLDELPRLR